MPSILILFELLNGEKFRIDFTILPDGWGDFDDGIILCSPKELGTQKNINDLVKILEDGVRCDSEYGYGKIFKEDVSDYTSDDVKKRAMLFIEKIKHISSIDDIKEISVVLSYNCDYMDEEEFVEQTTTYTYNRVTDKYTYVINGDIYDSDTYFTDYKDAIRI